LPKSGSSEPPTSVADDDSEPGAKNRGDDDVQLARALEVLKSWTYFDNLRKHQPSPSLQAKAPETAP